MARAAATVDEQTRLVAFAAKIIVPAAILQRFSGPEAMAVRAVAAGLLSVFGGVCASVAWNTPTGPSIVVAATLLFMLSLLKSRVVQSRTS